jgi:hypothetical protein
MKKLAVFLIVSVNVFSLMAQDWADMQKKTIHFYRYQRAGQKGVHCHNPYYEDITSNWPHQNDNYNGKDLSGGWYDAGDFVKFGLPFSSTVYILLKGYDVFPGGYSDYDSWDKFGVPDSIPDILNEVKFATDYIMKAVINNTTVVYDVGDGTADHACSLNGCGGPTNSSSVGNRPARLADGADVPGLHAASLALMSQLYRKYDAKYADSCLMKAKEAYQAGWSKRSKGVSSQYGEFYNTSKTPSGFIWHDKMMAGAIELYRVTKEQKYLDDLKTLGQNDAVMYNNIGYTNVAPIVIFEKWRQGIGTESDLLKHITWLKSKVINNPSKPSMNGVYYNQHWGMAGGVACASFASALAYVTTPDDLYKDFAEQQLLWVSGHKSGSRSWIVGYNNGPGAVHHRNAIWKNKLPEGGLVSGPDSNGNYQNSAGAYEYTEVALDYNAGIPGAIAFFRDLSSTTTVKVSKALSASAATIDFTKSASVTFSATLDKSASWKLVLTGSKSGATKTFSGSGTSISKDWTGDADEGNFVVYDAVRAEIVVENLAIYHLARAKASVEISGLKKSAFKTTDILVDNFDDSDFVNKHNGQWSLFTDEGIGGGSTTYPLALPKVNKEAGENGLGFKVILYTKADVIEHPFSGVRTTFNSKGTLVSLGNAKSIVFDVKGTTASVGSSFYVEIEQDDIKDSAYYGQKVTIGNDLWNRIRIPLTETALSVRSWKTVSVPLSLNKVKAIRFVNYESESVNIILDSIHIEDLKIIDPASVRDFRLTENRKIIQCKNVLSIPIELFQGRAADVEFLDMRGVRVKYVSVNKNSFGSNGMINVNLGTYADGLYVMRIISDYKCVAAMPISVIGR